VTEFNRQEWTIETAKAHVLALMEERDKRYEQRFQASQKAIDEARERLDLKLAGQNEWRDAMDDKDKTYATKVDLAPINEQLRKCLTKSDAFAMISVVAAVIGVLLEVLNFAMFQHK
jgi:hypothetical protein